MSRFEANRNFPVAYLGLAAALAQLGRLDEAHSSVKALMICIAASSVTRPVSPAGRSWSFGIMRYQAGTNRGRDVQNAQPEDLHSGFEAAIAGDPPRSRWRRSHTFFSPPCERWIRA